MGRLSDLVKGFAQVALSVAAFALSAVNPIAGAALMVVGSPAAPMPNRARRDRSPPPDALPDSRDSCVRASAIGLQTSVPFGPDAYIAPAVGVCLEPEIYADMPLLVDPDARPEPGDFVVIHVRDEHALAFRNERGRMTLLDQCELEAPDAEVAELLQTHTVAPAGRWAYGKRLVKPLPPRETWADDTNHSLVVETLNPHVELRAHLANVVAVDKVIAVLDFSGDPHMSAEWAKAMALRRAAMGH